MMMTMVQPVQVPVGNPTRPKSVDRWRLVLCHRERLLRIARRRLANAYEAEDCVHDALLRCATFDNLDDRRVGEFLTATVVRLCADYRRQAARRQVLMQRVRTPDMPPDPEDIVCEQASSRWLLEAAGNLRGRERQILLARANGFSTAQAASLFGITLKAAEGAFTRGRARLRALCDQP
jgi:RNA polymerase sigma-70 factor (ECF subfamily)